ncbi:Ig-like domain-containing protein [Neobacillus niacini]|uniref:Ig-like domain-containing protein n=1 Tax=Neobacillus niacini TaxID=86668 RepID=UPI00203D3BBD|nr:Ig-like domain-containing protein [Neobacillus niacini]MCM3693163.1 Ig-like domain-containing protein [Neobacillus niacini]
MRKRPIILSALCLLLALPNAALANSNQAQTPQSVNVEAGEQVNAEVKSTAITALAEDYTAPVLVNATVDKTSVGVGESISITAEVTDDLSEVARVEAVLVHDGGWKFLPLTLDTETNEWKGTYTIEEYDRSGTWTIEFDMYDALGNYDYSVGPDVEVVNPTGGDTESPTVGPASVSPLNVVANQEFTIKAEVSDNVQVGNVRAEITNFSSSYYVPLTLNTETNQWEGSYSLSEDDLSGSWYVYIDTFDTAGNFSFSENPLEFVLSNPLSDGNAPSIGEPVFSQTSAYVNDTIQIKVPVSDDKTGVSSVFASFSHADTPNEVHTTAFGFPSATEGEWVIDLYIDSSFQSGAWNVVIYASDKAGNSVFKEQIGAFDVMNDEVDIIPPDISNVVVTPQGEVQVGDTVTVTAKVTDNVGVDSVNAIFDSQLAYEFIPMSYDQANDQWVGTFPIQETTPPGFYRVSVNALDKGWLPNWADAEGSFTVVNPEGDYTGPVISDVLLDKTEVDAGASVTISATVEDAESGVAFVTVNYGNNFDTIDLTYDSTLQKWIGTIPVPTNIPDGEVVTINSVTAVDMAGNPTPYFGAGSFLVHNPDGDFTAPVLAGLEITPAVARVGDVIQFKAKVTDNKTGVKEVYLWMGDQPEIPLTYDEPSDSWIGSYTVKENDPSGEYPVWFGAGDNNGNYNEYDSQQSVTIDNSEADVTAPVVEAVEITPAEANVGDTVIISATLSDADSGVFSAFARVTSPDGGKSESITLALNTATNKWEGTYEITEFDVPGTWQVDVTAYDVAGNDGSNAEAYPFVINNPDNGDETAPSVVSFAMTPTTVWPGETLHFEAEIADEDSGVKAAVVTLFNSENLTTTRIDLTEANGVWSADYIIPEFTGAGFYSVKVEVEDNAGNVANYLPSESLLILNEAPDETAPSFEGISISPETAAAGDEVTFKLTFSDSQSGVKNARLILFNPDGPDSYNADDTRGYRYIELTQQDNQWVGTYTVAESDPAGAWTLSYEVEDNIGNANSAAIGQVLEVVKAPVELPVSVNEVSDKDSSVTGQTQAGAKVEVKANGTIIGSTTAGADGKFTVTIPVQKAGTELVVTAADDAGNTSAAAKVVVKDVTAPEQPTVNQVTESDTSVTGKAEAGSKVEVKANGAVIGSGTTGEDETFSVTIPAQKAGTELDVTAADNAGNVSAAAKAVVKDVTTPDQPTVNEVTEKDTSITGKAEAGSKVEVKANETVIGSATVGNDGAFTVTIPLQKAGTELEVTAIDGAGNASTPVKVVVKDVTAPDLPSVNEVTDKATSVTGKAEAGSNVEVKVNGTIVGSTTAGADGTFTVTIPVQKAGTELEVTATDKAGNISAAAKVVVKDVTPPNQPTVSDVTDKATSVTGTTEAGSIVEVKANGSSIGSGTAGADGKFTVTILVQKAGTELTVTATDKAGNLSAAAKVVVKDVTAPNQPTVSDVTDKATSVTGTAEAGSSIEVKANGSAIGSGTAGADGKFTVTIPVQKAGTELTVTATDKAGNLSAAAKVVVKDVTAPNQPTVSDVTDKATSVTGTAEAGTIVEVKANGSAIGSGTAGTDGKFTVTIPVQKAGTELVVTATDKAGNVSTAAKVVVKDVTAPAQPAVNQVTDTDTSVTGKAEAGSKVEVKATGKLIGSTTAGTEGTFTVTIPVQKEGTELEVTATDKAGNVSTIAKIVVKDTTASEKPSVNEVTDKDASVTGIAEAGSKVDVKVNGSAIGSAIAATDGKFTVAIPVQKAGTELVVTATDKAGNISAVVIVVVKDITAPNQPSISEVTDKSTSVTGTAEAGSKIEVKANGAAIGSGTAGADGKFTVTIPVQKAGTELTVTAIDKAGNVSGAAKVVVKDVTAPNQPSVSDVTDKDTSVTGTTEAGAKVEVKANGTVIGSAAAGADGKFTVNIPVQKAGTELAVTATDKAGNVSAAAKVVVKDQTPSEKPTVNEVTDKATSVTGKAEAGSKVEVRANGTIIGSATAGADGTFTVTIPVQKAGTELAITATDKAGNVSAAVKVIVKDVTGPGQPSVNQVTDKDPSVSGSAEAGSKVEVKANGSTIGSATAGADGKFTVTIPVQKAGTELVVTATDKAGNVSAGVKVVVKDVTPPAKPTVNEVTDKDTSVTGKAEAGSKIEVKANGTVIGSSTTATNGEFAVKIPAQKGGTNLVITASDAAGNVSQGTTITVKGTTTAPGTSTLVTLAGDTRYDTAIKVSQTGWKTANSVLLVNAFAIVDGLTATPLASAKDAPILLTAADSIPQSTLDELARLKTKEIILIGGELVISPKVESLLKQKGYKVIRIGGITRYATSLLIAKELDKLMDVSTIYVAYGFGEPDALSISAQAGLKKQPIILADLAAVPAETLAWLKNEQLTDAYFIGGEDVVAPSILTQIDKITSANVLKNRIAGSNRHETNAKVFSKFYSNVELSSILVTKSETLNLVDALTAGPLAAKLGSPVLLVSTPWGILQSQRQVLAGKHFKHVYQVGGGVNPTALDEVLK